MKPEISIITPGIRVPNWESMYDSVCKSTTRPFEIIFVGPYALPPSLQELRNIKYVKDFGAHGRCLDIGMSMCESELMTWNADDGTYVPGMLDKAIDAFKAMTPDPKNVLAIKYMEGQRIVQPDSYFKLINAYPPVIPVLNNPDWWIFNLVITKTEYFRYLGWDCRYETVAFAFADMAVRAQRDGCITQMFGEPIVFHSHGHNDHAPVESAHNENDYPTYVATHNNPDAKIVTDNGWKTSPSVWGRRFH